MAGAGVEPPEGSKCEFTAWAVETTGSKWGSTCSFQGNGCQPGPGASDLQQEEGQHSGRGEGESVQQKDKKEVGPSSYLSTTRNLVVH